MPNQSHPWCVVTPEGTRFFSNAPCAASSALKAGVPVQHPTFGTYERGDCVMLAGMQCEGDAYKQWLEEQKERV